MDCDNHSFNTEQTYFHAGTTNYCWWAEYKQFVNYQGQSL